MPLDPPATLIGQPPRTEPAVPKLKLCAFDSEVRTARDATTRMLAGLVPAPHLDDLKLIVSEMVTNAIRAARAYAEHHGFAWTYLDTPVHLAIACGPLWSRLDVRDPNRTVPVPSMTDPLAESGRGLLLIGTLAADVWPTIEPDHKVMHALVPMPGAVLTEAELVEARR